MSISNSATEKSELLAESFADVFANNDAAEPLSKAICDVLNDRFGGL